MIYVDLKGNLGNQMFNYALARKIQKETGQQIVLNSYNLENKHKNYKMSLKIFKLNDNVLFSNEKLPSKCNCESLLYKLISKTRIKFLKKTYYKFFSKRNIFVWADSTYVDVKINKKRLSKHQNIYISGFWQSPLYCNPIRDELLNDFQLVKELNPKYFDLYYKIKNTNSVCVSVRRGDYISNPIYYKKHFVCNNEYFSNSVKLINKKIQNPTLVMFSDDILWVKNNMKYNNEVLYEEDDTSLTDKIILMSSCKNFILSNSTFSWWVEFLCTNKDKVSIAPSRWYADNTKADLYQDYWELVRA